MSQVTNSCFNGCLDHAFCIVSVVPAAVLRHLINVYMQALGGRMEVAEVSFATGQVAMEVMNIYMCLYR